MSRPPFRRRTKCPVDAAPPEYTTHAPGPTTVHINSLSDACVPGKVGMLSCQITGIVSAARRYRYKSTALANFVRKIAHFPAEILYLRKFCGRSVCEMNPSPREWMSVPPISCLSPVFRERNFLHILLHFSSFELLLFVFCLLGDELAVVKSF